ncbi:MAG: insulinase family protein [Clostridia bacterium]|nr:insulinase family protein [Clostridia bacterium]
MDYNFDNEKVYNGFKCIKQEDIKDIKSYGYVFEHEKTKAKLVYIKNDDKNKVFSIAFRTPPTNNTGIPHIIEHSTLCGSKKYPVKEPFVELLKGSVNTFLNAMTFPDKTLYPIASTNEKDFMNLMSVYLDAVFYPNIYNKKEIFMQEGWHYELLNKKDPLTYKGVVYNEMKGVYSSPESVLVFEIFKSLYPDNIYYKEYGGYPAEIPDLTYEEFLAFHKKYYHPSNSYIYLYGNLDPNEAMKYINEEYLNNFEYKEIDSKIIKQEKLPQRVYVEKPYAISNDSEDLSKKYIMSMNYSIGDAKDIELAFAMRMLKCYLLDLSGSPLKKVVVEQGLVSDMDGMYEEDLMQPIFSIMMKELKYEDKDLIIKNIEDELRRIVNEGIDHELMEGVINRTEFGYRRLTEGDPLGLNYNYNLFQTWLYDGDPLDSLYFEGSIETIRNKFKDGYFENLIKEYLLDNTHSSICVLTPDTGLKEKTENELKEKLANIKAKMTDKEIKQVIKDTKNLIKLQMKPDKKKDLETIPTLKISDISKEAEKIDVIKEDLEGTTVYRNDMKTNKISYVDLTFDSKKVSKDNIPYINLLCNLLTEISTTTTSYEDISKKIGMAAGDMDFVCQVLSSHVDVDVYDANVCCHIESLQAKRKDIIEIAKDVILNTKFDEEQKIKEVIGRLRVVLEEQLLSAGHAAALKRIQSYYSQSGKYADMISGFDFYEFIVDLDNNFDSKKEEIKERLYQVKNDVFLRENLSCTYVGEEGTFDETKDMLLDVIHSLNENKDKEYNEYKLDNNILNEGILTQSDVQYVGMGANFRKLGFDYSGSVHVLKHILEYDYLWNNVRVKGGAYGSKLAVGIPGDFIFASYRDPNLSETYANYKKAVNYLKSFKSTKDFDKYIIGTIGTFDMPHGPYAKTKIAERRDKRGITFETVQKERDEILQTTPSTIKGYANMLKAIVDQNMICTIGNERKIKESKDTFKTLRTLKGKLEE